jgi:hypothetical protein
MANNDRRCSAECPHEPHTFGGRPMQYCEGVQTAPSKTAETKGSDGFWSRHEAEMRKARLLQAAATIYGSDGLRSCKDAVTEAFDLEVEISARLKRERATSGHS